MELLLIEEDIVELRSGKLEVIDDNVLLIMELLLLGEDVDEPLSDDALLNIEDVDNCSALDEDVLSLTLLVEIEL